VDFAPPIYEGLFFEFSTRKHPHHFREQNVYQVMVLEEIKYVCGTCFYIHPPTLFQLDHLPPGPAQNIAVVAPLQIKTQVSLLTVSDTGITLDSKPSLLHSFRVEKVD